jgi:exosortase/archaeosortase family protein
VLEGKVYLSLSIAFVNGYAVTFKLWHMFLKKIKTTLSAFIDINFFIRFFLLLTAVYYFNIFFVGMVDSRGKVYSSFLDNYLNYTACIRYFVLYTSNAIAHIFGIDSYILFPDYLKTANRSWIKVEPMCLGLSLISFWVAFILANKETIKRKILWGSAGIAGICIINSFRIAFLLMAFEHRWNSNTFSVNHTLSNYAFYLLIIFMIYLYTKNAKKYTHKIV